MINKILYQIFEILISIVDYPNKIKIISFLKSKYENKPLKVIDIGAHKGETINLFFNNFEINKIYAFEPNNDLYQYLIKKKKFKNKKIKIFNQGIGFKDEIKTLNIMFDSSSSTINQLDENSLYFRRKKYFLYLFSKNKNLIKKKQKIIIKNLSKFILQNKIDKINILKIDTEGYEFEILKGINKIDFKKIEYIYFEHHYDLMIKKRYKFHDINFLLNQNNFYQKYKLKMNYRKTFEYIYENRHK